jgi:LacI family transcriptional regulator
MAKEAGKQGAGRPGRERSGRVNQQLLAERLNLSQTTVSRALAHHASINAETKAMVWDLAAQMGYSMSTPVKVRGGGRTKGQEAFVIGVIISIPKKHRGHIETSQIILRGIAEQSTHHRVTVDVLYHEPAANDAKLLQKRIRQNRWSGCILVHPMRDELVEILARTIPSVSVVENYRREYIDSVDVDQIDAIGGLVQALYNNGHRKMGFASWVYDVPTPWVFHRFGAFAETLFRLELKLDQANVLNLKRSRPQTPEAVADGIVKAVSKGTTAFVFAADHQAYEMAPLLRNRGLRIPEDCSLTGFDGIHPPDGEMQMATVRVPYDEIGRSAFHQLMHRISFPTSPRRHVLVDGELDLGASIARVN